MFAYNSSQLCQEDYISYVRLHALTFYLKCDNNFILIIYHQWEYSIIIQEYLCYTVHSTQYVLCLNVRVKLQFKINI